MSLNELMHPRNPYKTRPDFKSLALKYPEFRSHLTTDLRGNVNLDFKTGVGVLTKILLHQDFGLSIKLPLGALVPTLPLRFNYLLWIQDILQLNQINANIKGLDIGVGSSCIYPLLAAKHFNWKMLGNEAHEESLSYAQRNVTENKLENNIVIKSSSSFFGIIEETQEILDFTMCNPPFFDTNCYESCEEKPGLDHEMMTEGGEEEFVKYMIKESEKFNSKVKLFTCMLGKKSTLITMKKLFYSLVNENQGRFFWSFTEFCQGKTMRWGIVWTFSNLINLPKESILSVKKKNQRMMAPMSFSFSTQKNCIELFHDLNEMFTSDLKCRIDTIGKPSKTKVSCKIQTFHVLWKNQRRLRREKIRLEDNPSDAKRARISFENNEPDTLQLHFEMNMHKFKDNSIIEFFYLDGKSGKEGLHQVIQFLKNKLGIHSVVNS
ncbi:U6 small nuclear RNA (adenine-(43)-N(6))-methyltransferase [Lepeophtheirus salmonis]|uniref:U6 small nuclear RNA (adenine-(43)-N(6))-methyltransferase n=1 Tax=Lepeophtheirus salmonis TaxID=72036 RepID=A0A0K2U7N4_LEPSM|nr:U6 small nuclear RNA (adenine-(43)-N(6))-methyltransferase-like [Lepeophtheirus salmonis]